MNSSPPPAPESAYMMIRYFYESSSSVMSASVVSYLSSLQLTHISLMVEFPEVICSVVVVYMLMLYSLKIVKPISSAKLPLLKTTTFRVELSLIWISVSSILLPVVNSSPNLYTVTPFCCSPKIHPSHP